MKTAFRILLLAIASALCNCADITQGSATVKADVEASTPPVTFAGGMRGTAPVNDWRATASSSFYGRAAQ